MILKRESGDNMNDLFTYIKMFGNIDFNHMGLTEADNAVFSRLAYLDFNGCESKQLKEIAKILQPMKKIQKHCQNKRIN